MCFRRQTVVHQRLMHRPQNYLPVCRKSPHILIVELTRDHEFFRNTADFISVSSN